MDDDFLLDDPSTGPLSSGVPTPSLDCFASERLCAAVYDAPKPPAERVTMTPYVLNLARQVLVLVAGDDKVAAVSAALESDARDQAESHRVLESIERFGGTLCEGERRMEKR